jgi:hypothetical protein
MALFRPALRAPIIDKAGGPHIGLEALCPKLDELAAARQLLARWQL